MSHGYGSSVPVVIRVQPPFATPPDGRGPRDLPVRASIGDTRTDLRVGDNPVSLPPGEWPIRVWLSYCGVKSGRAEITVDTRPGRPILLYYTTPRTIYNQGVLGYEPVERPGGETLALIYTLVPLIGLLAAVIAFLLLR
ncbi:hypothetical protein ACFOY4_34345 [Actinomadura syzygii]|uniref:Uncharacterized protein n=1 Tax=Actinomadura syzygii TaxID=1427538 RepID=A0A5D0ULZ8_9ACTN|nr:hypothetical protein [Actinomadura syzygii]TYC18856.1 hypothetical protein FXF65_03745 [Actinomadura syzygii]